MPATQVAEALYRAFQQKESGRLTLVAGARRAELRLSEGNLVEAKVAFGHQSMAQSLLLAEKLKPSQLDALWARGEGGVLEPESLDEIGAVAEEAERLQL